MNVQYEKISEHTNYKFCPNWQFVRGVCLLKYKIL